MKVKLYTILFIALTNPVFAEQLDEFGCDLYERKSFAMVQNMEYSPNANWFDILKEAGHESYDKCKPFGKHRVECKTGDPDINVTIKLIDDRSMISHITYALGPVTFEQRDVNDILKVHWDNLVNKYGKEKLLTPPYKMQKDIHFFDRRGTCGNWDVIALTSHASFWQDLWLDSDYKEYMGNMTMELPVAGIIHMDWSTYTGLFVENAKFIQEKYNQKQKNKQKAADDLY